MVLVLGHSNLRLFIEKNKRGVLLFVTSHSQLETIGGNRGGRNLEGGTDGTLKSPRRNCTLSLFIGF